ncbi:MAG: hypothetical protein ACKO0Y_07830, partial [Bacteroidota bacterium]
MSNLQKTHITDSSALEDIRHLYDELIDQLKPEVKHILEEWDKKTQNYRNEEFSYTVRNKQINVENFIESLSHTKIPKIATPQFKDWGEIVRWSLR